VGFLSRRRWWHRSGGYDYAGAVVFGLGAASWLAIPPVFAAFAIWGMQGAWGAVLLTAGLCVGWHLHKADEERESRRQADKERARAFSKAVEESGREAGR
jgi:hypothetical protein